MKFGNIQISVAEIQKASDIVIISKIKSVRCRNLFGIIVTKFSGGKLNNAVLNKYNMILHFLEQSEHSYIIREHELKKLSEEKENGM